MTDNINPSHYKDGPFECIELSSLLSFDWGNVIKYCYRWRDKNGVVKGQIDAYGKTADHCRSMLGYSGSMPSEVPNQSEDAK